MRDYGKLSPFFWTRGSGKKLRGNPDAQVVAAYLSTAPSANMIGIYYVSIACIASDTGVPEKRTRAAMKAIEAAGYAFYDFEQEIVWVPNHARFEVGLELRPGDKRRPRVYAELRQVTDHRFANDFRDRYAEGWGLTPSGDHTASVANMPHRRGIEGASKGHPSTETDTEGASMSAEPSPSGTGSGSGTGTGSGTGSGTRGLAPEPVTGVRSARVLGLDGEGGAAWHAWRTGVSLATGKPVSDLGSRDKPDLVALVNAHSGGLRGQPLMDWISDTAAAFVKASDGRFGFTTRRCRDWLDGGRSEARGGPSGRHVQSAENRAWTPPEDMP